MNLCSRQTLELVSLCESPSKEINVESTWPLRRDRRIACRWGKLSLLVQNKPSGKTVTTEMSAAQPNYSILIGAQHKTE